MDERAIGENNFEAKDVGGRKAILETMRAAGFFRDVAADAADGLGRRVRRIEVFLRLDASGDIQIDDARFDDDARIRKIDFEDTIHAREADYNSVFDGKRAAAQARARPARD